ncbi:MAG: hypothetical protein ACQES4_10280 [Bacillota bacterium]
MFSPEAHKHLITTFEEMKNSALVGDAEILILIRKFAKDNKAYFWGILDYIGNRFDDPKVASYYISMLRAILTDGQLANRDTGKSKADKVMISILLKVVLLMCLKDSKSRSTDSDYPLVIDSPFICLDQARAEELLSFFSKLADQVIIMCGDSDYELIKNLKSGKSYLLINNEDAFKTKIINL